MDIDMTRGLKATVYLTDIDNREVLLKVWMEKYFSIIFIFTIFTIIIIVIIIVLLLIIITITIIIKVWLEEFICTITITITITIIITIIIKVWLEECNWKEYPALSVVEVDLLY